MAKVLQNTPFLPAGKEECNKLHSEPEQDVRGNKSETDFFGMVEMSKTESEK